MDIGVIIAIIAGVPSILVAALLGYREWKSGSGRISSEVIANYEKLDEQNRKTIEQYKLSLAEATTSLRQSEINLRERVAYFDGIIITKDKQIDDLTKINANRNPDLEKVLADIHSFMEMIMKTNVFQTEILQSQQKRNKKIDDATDSHEGEVLRKPPGKIET